MYTAFSLSFWLGHAHESVQTATSIKHSETPNNNGRYTRYKGNSHSLEDKSMQMVGYYIWCAIIVSAPNHSPTSLVSLQENNKLSFFHALNASCLQFLVGYSNKKIHASASADSFFVVWQHQMLLVWMPSRGCAHCYSHTPRLTPPRWYVRACFCVCMCAMATSWHVRTWLSFLPLLFSFLWATHFVPTHMHTLVVRELGHMPVASVSLWLK